MSLSFPEKMFNYFLKLLLGTIFLLVFHSCQIKSSDENDGIVKKSNVSIDGTRFIEGKGRQILLNGINLVNKNPEENYIGDYDSETFAIHIGPIIQALKIILIFTKL